MTVEPTELRPCLSERRGRRRQGSFAFVIAALLIFAACEDAPPPTQEPTAVALSEVTSRLIGNTGGDGVSLRSDCEADARVDGGWADGTRVRLTDRGAGRCIGWHLAESGGTTSWVRDEHLTAVPAATATPTAGPSVPFNCDPPSLKEDSPCQPGF